MKLGDKLFYSFEEAAEILHPLYTVNMLKKGAWRNTLPHHGGRGKGKVCFSDGDLRAIIKMSKAGKEPQVNKESKTSTEERAVLASSEPELPSIFRQTPRSKARHRSAA